MAIKMVIKFLMVYILLLPISGINYFRTILHIHLSGFWVRYIYIDNGVKVLQHSQSFFLKHLQLSSCQKKMSLYIMTFQCFSA